MSKIAKKPIEIKPGVTVTITRQEAVVNGPKGQLMFTIPAGIKAEVTDGKSWWPKLRKTMWKQTPCLV